jgi:hypothetical protein
MLEKMPNVECRTPKVFASRCQRNEEDPRVRSLIRVYSCSFVVNGFTAGNEEITARRAKGIRRERRRAAANAARTVRLRSEGSRPILNDRVSLRQGRQDDVSFLHCLLMSAQVYSGSESE